MKHYVVNVAHSVVLDIIEQVQFIQIDKPLAASLWFDGLWEKIQSLDTFPHRHPIAASESQAFDIEVRKLVFGNYLLLYTIDERNAHVEAVQFRHAARLPENSEEAGLD